MFCVMLSITTDGMAGRVLVDIAAAVAVQRGVYVYEGTRELQERKERVEDACARK